MFLSVCFVRFPFPSRGRAKRGYYRCERREESVKTCGDARTKGRLRLKLGAGSPPEAVRETRIPRRLTRVKPTPHRRLRRIIRETRRADEWRSKTLENHVTVAMDSQYEAASKYNTFLSSKHFSFFSIAFKKNPVRECSLLRDVPRGASSRASRRTPQNPHRLFSNIDRGFRRAFTF